jgi:hypothetical protein
LGRAIKEGIWECDNTFQDHHLHNLGTHVHIKPEEGGWKLNAIKKLTKAIVLFAPVIAE